VLLARVRTLLRQYETSEDAVFTIGPYTFRPSSKLLLNLNGSKVRLTEKETSILRRLYRAGQRFVPRQTLLQEVWGYNSEVTAHTLETHIYRLRQKIEKDAIVPVPTMSCPDDHMTIADWRMAVPLTMQNAMCSDKCRPADADGLFIQHSRRRAVSAAAEGVGKLECCFAMP
jgi:Transcriptional regulatory protein, C terminal